MVDSMNLSLDNLNGLIQIKITEKINTSHKYSK